MSAPHFTPDNYLDLTQTDHAAIFDGVTQAWEILPKLVHYLEEKLVSENRGKLLGYPVIGEKVFIGEDTVILGMQRI